MQKTKLLLLRRISAARIVGYLPLFVLASLFVPNHVLAMGNTTPDGGRVGGLCYNANNQSVAVISLESEIKACTDQGFQTIDFNQPVPFAICLAGNRVQKLDGNASSRTACVNTLGGKVVESGQPFPGMVIGGSSATPTGDTSDPLKAKAAEAGCTYDSNNGGTVTANKCKALAWLVTLIQVLSGTVGIVVVIMIVWGGIQYTSSRDNPQQAAAAKEHVRNAIIALVLYIFSIAILNWLVPGGVFAG